MFAKITPYSLTAKQERWTTCIFLSSKQYVCGKLKNVASQHRIVGPILVCPPKWKVTWTLECGVLMKLMNSNDWNSGNISHIIWQFTTIVVCMQCNAIYAMIWVFPKKYGTKTPKSIQDFIFFRVFHEINSPFHFFGGYPKKPPLFLGVNIHILMGCNPSKRGVVEAPQIAQDKM